MARIPRHLVVLAATLATIVALVVPASAHEDGHIEALRAAERATSLRAFISGDGPELLLTDRIAIEGTGAKPSDAPLTSSGLSTPLAIGENVEYVTGSQGWTGGHAVTRDDRLYVGAYGIGMRMFDITDPAAAEQTGEYAPGNRADAVPEAREFDGRHIATLNGTRRTTFTQDTRTDRSEFLDVTDPSDPVLLHEFVGQDDGEAHLGHFVVGQRLWIPAGGSGAYGGSGGLAEDERPDQTYEHHRGLRIYDLSPVIDNSAEMCDPDAGWDNPCAPELLFAGDPVELWESSPYRDGREVGHAFTHTHDATPHEGVHVEGLGERDLLLLAEGGSYLDDGGNTGSVFIIDITDVSEGAAPVVLNRFIHPGYDDGRDHDPIRYYHEAQLLDGDPSVMIVTDEDMHSGCDAGGAIYFVQLSPDLTEAIPLSEWHIPTETPAAVCSVHNFTSDGHLAYVGSYNAGLQVLDLSDPEVPRRVGYYIAEGATTWGAYYHDGFVYLGDMSRGLDVVRYVGPKPDLAVSESDVVISRRGNGPADITVIVRNIGEVDASGVVVRFTDSDGERITDDVVIPRIAAGDAEQVSLRWQPGRGERELTVTVDPDGDIDESDETNNSATVTVAGPGGGAS
jgi:hypothetical protein